ncbi:MAG: 50S ribosomal protein L7/L12 [Candidatus Hydrothermales bacterium]
MAQKLTLDQIIEGIEQLTVLELAELIKKLEEKFGVSAQAPVFATAAGVAPGVQVAEEKEEKTEFTVILADAGSEKIKVLREVRAITGLGLKEAKELIDSVPKPIKEGVSKNEAEDIKKKLEALGAKVELK